MKKQFILKNIILMMLLSAFLANAQNGYIYVHKKASSEDSSVNFSFDLKQGSTPISSFILNDRPNSLNAFDLGNSHGSGEGQLWAVVNNGNSTATTHDITGTLYTRAANSQQWVSTGVTTARSVDGIDLNTAVYTNSSSNVFLYNASGTSTQISNTGNIIDVAAGGGIIVAVTSTGALLKYSGTPNNWTTLAGTNVSNAFRVDVNPTTQQIVFIRTSDQNVYRRSGSTASATATLIAFPAGTTSVGGGNNGTLRDIAVSNEGTIFSNYTSNGEANVFEYTTSWSDNRKSRGLSGLTAGIGNQAWGITKVNVTQGIAHSIYARAVPGTTGNPAEADWLDDERVRPTSSAPYGNSIMIPVAAGTYTLTESSTTGWNNSNILLYDPTGNSSSNLATREATIIVAAGEVVNVVYSNAKLNSKSVPAICGTNIVVTFEKDTSAGSTEPYGIAFDGFSSYHYRSAGIVGDGYYAVVKNSSEWYGGQNLTLTNHTPLNPLLPGNPVTNPPDPNGYFAMFNASYATDDFFRQTVTGLSVGTTYEFAFWVADLSPNASIRPNVTMGITNPATGLLIGSISTGDLSNSNWVQYKFNFVATSATAEIFLKNNSIGGSGNDVAIDDVSFAPAPPVLVPSSGPTGITVFCSNTPTQYQFTNPQAGGTWSTTTPTLITIDATGKVTTILNAVGTATVLYTYSSSSGCTSTDTINITIGNCACYDLPNTASTGSATQHGITLLNRAGETSSSWPMSRKSAFTVLESNTKGFVITRMSTTQIAGILSPQEGMMVYDTNEGCLKLYDGTAWSCFNTATCP